jgi:predicted N-acetyltransferase YhbS
MPELVPLSSCDPYTVEELLDSAFGSQRKKRTAYMLRAGTKAIENLSFGLLEDSRLIGSIQSWPVCITADDEIVPLLLVGPVAIAPDKQNQGLGRKMMEQLLDAALLEGNPPMVMIGDPDYYEKFGFFAKETNGWQLPGPFEAHRLLLRNESDYILPSTGMIGPDCND